MIGRSSPLLCLSLSRQILLFATTIVACASVPALGWGQQPLHERVDAVLESGLTGPSVNSAADHEFLRRVHLDLTGRIPTAQQLREFLADPAPDKRAQVVDRLLASPEFVRHMSVALDVMLMERRADKYVPTAEWRQYLFDAIAANKPLNELYREILMSDGGDPAVRASAKFVLEREVEPNLMTRDVGRIVFGMDMQCAQCHDHPLIADYEQNEYYGLFAFYQRSALFLDAKDNNKAYVAESAEGDASFKSVFTKAEGKTLPRLPGGNEIEDAVLASDDVYIVKPDKEVRPVPRYSRRQRLAEQVARGDNRAFRRNVANRLWAHMMGRGLVDPVDLHHDENPPSHPELLDLLADELAANQFNLRAFLRELALTRAYQRSVDLPEDWRSIATQAATQLAALEAELATCEANQTAVLERAASSAAALKTKSEELAPQRAAFKEERVRFAAAEKAARDAENVRAASIQQIDAKRPVVQSLVDAVTSAKRAAELLPNEAALTDALAKLQAQHDKVTAELTALEAALPAQQEAAAAAAAALLAGQQALQNAQAVWDQASAPLRDLETQATADSEELRHAQNRLLLARRRAEAIRQLSGATAVFDAAAAAREKLLALETQQSTVQQQLLVARQQTSAESSPGTANASIDALHEQLQQLNASRESALDERNKAVAAEQEMSGNLDRLWIEQAAAAPLKPLSPEQLAWSMMQATGVLPRQQAASLAEIQQKPDAPSDPALLAAAVEKDVNAKLEASVPEFVRLFGGGAGQPQNEFFATVDQALFFANGGYLSSWLAPSGGNLTERLLNLTDAAAIADELYMSVLSRPPTADEALLVRQSLDAQPQDKSAVVQQLAWALLTSAEFRFSP